MLFVRRGESPHHAHDASQLHRDPARAHIERFRGVAAELLRGDGVDEPRALDDVASVVVLSLGEDSQPAAVCTHPRELEAWLDLLVLESVSRVHRCTQTAAERARDAGAEGESFGAADANDL